MVGGTILLAMKWFYLVGAIALLVLGLMQTVGVIGSFRGWWVSDSRTVRESGVWALVLIGLSLAGLMRWWRLTRTVSARGFSVRASRERTE